MPAKPVEAGGPTFRTIGFYPADHANVEKIREKLKREDPTCREVAITDVIRYALAVVAAEPQRKKRAPA